MPSTPITATATATATTAVMERLTYLCNSCNTDIFSYDTTSTILICPHCNSLFSSNPNPNPNPNPNYSNLNSSHSSIPSLIDPSRPTTTSDSIPFSTVTASDDNFLLDSPYLHRLIHHLTNSNDSSQSSNSISTSHHHSPTSKSAIESIPMVKITSAFLEIDPIVLCAVCKDQFVINDETKQLPCKHMYHPDCILPWLSQHNSCPVCRFQLPKEVVSGGVKVRRRSRSRVLRLGDMMEDVDDDEAMLGIGFRNLHHIGQTVEVDVLPDSAQTNGVEDASSWPNWHVNGDAVNGVNVHAGWGDDADVVMP